MVERPNRFFIGAGTSRYPGNPEFEDRPELVDEVRRMADLFTTQLGYRRVSSIEPDISAAKLRERLGWFLTALERSETDQVVFYYTGHGVIDSGDFVLPFPETTTDLARTGAWASELATWLFRGTRVQCFLVILDTCHAGAAASELARSAIQQLDRLGGLARDPNVAILAAARPIEQAQSGAFTQAFAAAVSDRAVGGHEPQFLPLDSLTADIRARTPSWQHARLFIAGDGVTRFLPNPRFSQWLHGLDLRRQRDLQQSAARQADLRDHVFPRAMGLDSPRDDPWLFTGRHAALRRLSRWLQAGAGSSATLVVTGDPGSGKSALLSRLHMLANPSLRPRVPRLDELPTDTLPPTDSIDCFIHARGRTDEHVLDALCAAAGVDADSPGRFLAEIAERDRPLTVIIDALDESSDPDHLIRHLLYPLVRAAAQGKLRLLLGTRRHLLERLGSTAEHLDLDTEEYADSPSVWGYARRCLIELNPGSPYTAVDPRITDAVADAVAAAAGRSFLVALIVARNLALRDQPANPYDGAWRGGLPRIAADAMRADLDQRLGPHAAKARDLLLPLAFAQGSGLPWENVWAATTRSAQSRPYTNADLDWLVEHAGFYVMETLSRQRSVYRLYHEALAEHLRSGQDPARVHRRIAERLIEQVVALPGGERDWAHAHPYTRGYLAVHAAAGGILDDLLLDPDYLLAADRPRLLAAQSGARSNDARAAAHAYQRAAHHLRTKPAEQHRSYLELAAHCYKAAELATQIARRGRSGPWVPRWADWVPGHPHRTFKGHATAVRAVAVAELDGRPVVVTAGDDRTVRVWDLASGHPVDQLVTSHEGPVRALAVAELDGGPVVLSGSDDRTVQVLDLASGQPVGTPLRGHGSVIAVAVAKLDGRQVVVTAGDDQVRVWDLASRQPLGRPLAGHHSWVWALAVLDARPMVVSGSYDRTVRVWDLAEAVPVGQPLRGHTGSVRAVAVTELDGRPIVASGSDDRTVRVWDLETGQPVGQPLTGHTGPVNALATTELDGRLVAVSGSEDRTMRVWELATGQPVGQPLAGHSGPVHALAMARVDGSPVAVSGAGDRTVRTWDLTGSQPAGQPLTGHTGPVNAVAVTMLADRLVAVTGSNDRTVRVWDLVTGQPVGHPMAGHDGPINALAVTTLRERPAIVTGSDDGTVRLWDLASGQPVGQPLRGHRQRVSAVAVADVNGSPMAVTGGEDYTVQVWDLTGSQTRPGPDESVNAMAVTNLDDRPVLIIATANDRSVGVWDLASRQRVGRPMVGHTGPINALAVTTRDGHPAAVTGSDDRTVRVWNLVTGEPIDKPMIGHTGRIRALAATVLNDRAVAVTGSDDRTVRMWDLISGHQVGQPLTGHTGPINALAVTELEGRPVAVTVADDWTVRTWDLTIGQPLLGPRSGTEWSAAFAQVSGRHTVIAVDGRAGLRVRDRASGQLAGPPLTGHVGSINALAVTELDGQPVVVTGSDDQELRTWDLTTGEAAGPPLIGHSSWVTALAATKLDGRPVAVSGGDDRTVLVWDLASGQPVGQPLSGHTGPINALTVTELDGRPVVITAADDRSVRSWDLTSGKPLHQPLIGHTGRVMAVVVVEADHGRTVISIGDDRIVRRWDLATGTPLGSPFSCGAWRVRALATAVVDGRSTLLTGSDEHAVEVWDLRTGQPLGKAMTGHAESINAVVVATWEGQPIAITASSDWTVRIWDLISREPIGPPLIGHSGPVRAVAVAEHAGQPLVVSGSQDRTLRTWDLATRQPLLGSVRQAEWRAAVGDLDSRNVVVAGDEEANLRVRDLDDGQLFVQPMTGHTGRVRAVAVAERAGGPLAISAGDDRTVRLWDLSSGQPLGQPLAGHSGAINAVQVTDVDSRQVAVTGGEDSTVRIWDLSRGRPWGRELTGHTGAINALVAANVADRPVAVTGGDDRTVRIWDLTTGQPITEPLVGHDDPITALTLAEIRGRPALVTGDQGGVLGAWWLDELGLQRGWRTLFRWHRPRLTILDRRPEPITALTYHPDRGIAAGQGSTIELDPAADVNRCPIDVDAQITSLRFQASSTLVVTTLQGILVFDLTEKRSAW
jgi:WD40 repeat protein